MSLDSGLLSQAKAAEARAVEAERTAEAARTEFHRAVRRLQLAGGSLREIAQELGMSHQRVHQIVEASGGSRGWRGGRAGSGELLSCSFCGKNQKQVKKLIAGPRAWICGRCTTRARTVLGAAGKAVSTPLGRIERLGDDDPDGWCSFCGQSRYQVQAMAAAGSARICDGCLNLCEEIVSDEPA